MQSVPPGRSSREYGAGMKEAFDRICEALGRADWERDGLALYAGDCVELMARMPEQSVELTLTSPPYNIGKEYENALPLQEYVEWTSCWTRAVKRASAAHGAFWLNLGYLSVPTKGKAVPLPYLLWDRVPFYLVQEIVWHYGAGVAARHSFSPRNEKWLWYVNDPAAYTFNLDAVRDPNVKYPNQKKNGKLRVNTIGKNPSDVWTIPKVTTGAGRTGQRASPERTVHPAQFPLDVVRRIILACSNPGDVILEPFAGSGTTLLAAYETGRRCIAFEIEPRYIKIAAERIGKELDRPRQASLLTEDPAVSER
jgi:adenine-specific DNA-methyltransferase